MSSSLASCVCTRDSHVSLLFSFSPIPLPTGLGYLLSLCVWYRSSRSKLNPRPSYASWNTIQPLIKARSYAEFLCALRGIFVVMITQKKMMMIPGSHKKKKKKCRRLGNVPKRHNQGKPSTRPSSPRHQFIFFSFMRRRRVRRRQVRRRQRPLRRRRFQGERRRPGCCRRGCRRRSRPRPCRAGPWGPW